MKLTNFFKMLLTVFFVMSVLSSAHAGQTGVVIFPSAGEPKVKTGSSEIMPEKVAPKKEDQKVVPGKNTRSRSPMKVQQKPDKPMKPTIMCQGKPATIVAKSQTGGTLKGTEGPDVIVGLGGNDKINGLGGDDIICGGDGNDELEGASGNDRLFGGDGDDTLWGSDGNDELYGGRDTIGLLQDEENDGNDKIYGGAGNDGLYGGSGDDRLYGGDGDDHLNGGSGMDRLGGNDGNDVIEGGSGDDQLYGGSGDDVLYGYIAPKGGVNLLGGEDDVNDKLDGGIGNDICIVCNGNLIPPINCEK